jgi:hypothetical protein
MEGWMRHGVFPPPLLGAANDTKSVHFHLAVQDLWDLEGPPLSGVTDEEGVELQQRACEEMLAAARKEYAEGDPVVICDCPRGP